MALELYVNGNQRGLELGRVNGAWQGGAGRGRASHEDLRRCHLDGPGRAGAGRGGRTGGSSLVPVPLSLTLDRSRGAGF